MGRFMWLKIVAVRLNIIVLIFMLLLIRKGKIKAYIIQMYI